MNGKLYIVVVVCFSWIFAFFTFHDDLVPMTFNGETLDTPFLGGFNRPKIQWVDWNGDGEWTVPPTRSAIGTLRQSRQGVICSHGQTAIRVESRE